MSYYALTSRNSQSFTTVNHNVGVLLKEDGDELLTEDGDFLLLENPVNNPNLVSRSTKPYLIWDDATMPWSEASFTWEESQGYRTEQRH